MEIFYLLSDKAVSIRSVNITKEKFEFYEILTAVLLLLSLSLEFVMLNLFDGFWGLFKNFEKKNQNGEIRGEYVENK